MIRSWLRNPYRPSGIRLNGARPTIGNGRCDRRTSASAHCRRATPRCAPAGQLTTCGRAVKCSRSPSMMPMAVIVSCRQMWRFVVAIHFPGTR